MQLGIHITPWRRALCGLAALFLLLGGSLYAQVLPSDADSVVIDTTLKMKKVEPRTSILSPTAMSRGYDGRDRISFRLEDILYPDLLYRKEGFFNTLGQIGKPYRRWFLGADASFFGNDHFHNPFTGQENVYMINAGTEVPYFDTRTPFINAYYGQGKADLAQLRVDVAQNITPFLNVAVMYYRRNSSGVYTSFATNQDNIGVSSNFRTRNDRYHVFFNFLFQEHNEEINGGVSQDFTDYEDFFNKSSQPVGLASALLLRVQRSYYMRQFFRITGDTTDNAHRLRIYNGGQYQQFENEFTDSLIDENIQTWQFPVYPTLYSDAFLVDSSFIYEKFASWKGRYDMGLSYSFDKKWLVTHHEFGLQFSSMNFEKNLIRNNLTKFRMFWNGDLRYDAKPFAVRGDGRWSLATNNLFSAENLLDIGASLDLGKEKLDYTRKEAHEFIPKDSTTFTKTHRPFSLSARVIRNERNPSLQQAFGEGFQNITFAGNPGLDNSSMEHLRASVEWRSKAKWVDGVGETAGMHLRLTAFRSRMNRMIWFDSLMTLQQEAPGTYWQWQGIEGQCAIASGQIFPGRQRRLPAKCLERLHSAQRAAVLPADFLHAGALVFREQGPVLHRGAAPWRRVFLQFRLQCAAFRSGLTAVLSANRCDYASLSPPGCVCGNPGQARLHLCEAAKRERGPAATRLFHHPVVPRCGTSTSCWA